MMVQRVLLGSQPLRDLERRLLERTSDWDLLRMRRSTRPLMNMEIADHNVSVTFLVPGIQQDGINLNIEDQFLKIEHEAKGKATGFSRSIELPFPVDKDSAKATLNHGLLTIELEKEASAKPRTIEIQG